MRINELLKQRNMTKYALTKKSGLPHTTVIDLCNGKSRIEKCSADTLYKISKVLNVTMEDLIADSLENRPSFEIFKSNVCHEVKRKGDFDFIIEILQKNEIRKLFDKKRYPEALYLLAMLDYLSRVNGLPMCLDYNDIRNIKLKKPLYPLSVIAISSFTQSDEPKQESINNSIPEFIKFNIVESEVRNVV